MDTPTSLETQPPRQSLGMVLEWQHFEILLLLTFLPLLPFRLNTVVCLERGMEPPASEVLSNPMLLWFDLLKNTQNFEHRSSQGSTSVPSSAEWPRRKRYPGAMEEELQTIWQTLFLKT